MLDKGATRVGILEKTGAVLGCAGASLADHEGEICVLMGLSGSGKSTLLRAVNRLNKVTRGEVLVSDGDKHGRCRHLRRRRPCAGCASSASPWCSSSSRCCPGAPSRENVGFGLELAGMPEAERKARVDKQLEARRPRPVGRRNTATSCRAACSSASAWRAPLPPSADPADGRAFSALDPLIRTKLQDELLQLQKTLKKTIIFVSHDLEEALKLGNHITIMEGGRIVQTGRPEDIVLRPANDYVREFIANVNPLSVLTAYNVMRDARDLEPGGRRLGVARPAQDHALQDRRDRKVVDAERDKKKAIWVACTEAEKPVRAGRTPGLLGDARHLAATVMLAMHRADTAPVALFDEDSSASSAPLACATCCRRS